MKKRFAAALAKTGKRPLEVARLCGVEKGTAVNWFKGRTMPQADSFFTICKEYNLDMNWIILGKKTEEQK